MTHWRQSLHMLVNVSVVSPTLAALVVNASPGFAVGVGAGVFVMVAVGAGGGVAVAVAVG